MSSKIVMTQLLPFFPESFPDETLLSRISRFHLLSGNRTDDLTSKELFGKRLKLNMVVPVYALKQLSSKLPGEPDETLHSLLQENTLLPAFAPFLGTENACGINQELNLGAHYQGLGRIPQRVTGMYGESRLCVDCLRNDIAIHGIGYWHRCHQIPGVSVCHQHHTVLLQGCPNCRRPFCRPLHLLVQPWKECRCGWRPEDHFSQETGTPHDIQYAEFAAHLLQANMPPIKPAQLIRAYRQKLLAHGLRRKNRVAWRIAQEAIEKEYGTEFLSRTDAAFEAGRTRFWMRLPVLDGQIEIPLTRHIIFAMYLFGDFNSFISEVVAQDESPLNRLSWRNGNGDSDNPKQKTMRSRVQMLQAVWPGLTLDDLWKKSYATAEWLYEHDKAWLRRTFSEANASPVADDHFKAEDAQLAQCIDDGVDALYEAAGKPARVTKEKLRALLPKSIPIMPEMRERYPLMHDRIERHLESTWHFAVRRLLFAISEIRRLQATPIHTALRNIAGVNSNTIDALVTHFGWDIPKLLPSSFDFKADLARYAISRQWQGPTVKDKILGGRRHYYAAERTP